MSVYIEKKVKGVKELVSWVCVCVCVWHCVVGSGVCSADSSTQLSDIPPDSSELFTVPGLSEREKERKRERGVRRRRGIPRQKVGLEQRGWRGVSICLWVEMACTLVCFGVARFLPVLPSSPGDVWWRSGLSVGWNHTRGSKQATRLILSFYVDWSITQTFTRLPVPSVSHLQRVLHQYDKHPDFQLLALILQNLCFQYHGFHVIQELRFQLRWKDGHLKQ